VRGTEPEARGDRAGIEPELRRSAPFVTAASNRSTPGRGQELQLLQELAEGIDSTTVASPLTALPPRKEPVCRPTLGTLLAHTEVGLFLTIS